MGFLERAREASERGSQKRVIKRNLSAAEVAKALHDQASPRTPSAPRTPQTATVTPQEPAAPRARSESPDIPEKKEPAMTSTPNAPKTEPRPPAPVRTDAAKADYLGSWVHFEGTFRSDRDIEIDGQVKGNIEIAGGSLTVGPNAKIDADVKSKNLVVAGDLSGVTKVAERVDVRSTGTVRGELHTQSLFLEEGAVIDGIIRRGKDHS